MKYLLIAAGLLCMYPGSIPWALAQEKDASAVADRAVATAEVPKPAAGTETVRLQIPASPTYANETEVPLKTALIKWEVLTDQQKHYTNGFVTMAIVISNREMGCEALLPSRAAFYTSELSSRAREAEFPAVQNDVDFLARFSYADHFDARKSDRGLLGEIVFGKETKDFKVAETLSSGVIHFHYLNYFLNHISGNKNYYQSSQFMYPTGDYLFEHTGAKQEVHFDIYASDFIKGPGVDMSFSAGPYGFGRMMTVTWTGPNAPIKPGMLILKRDNGGLLAELDVTGASGIRQTKKTFTMKGPVHLRECPTEVLTFNYEKK